MYYFGTFGSQENIALQKLLPIIDKAIVAHHEGDYQKFKSVITPQLAEQITSANFMKAYQEITPQLGTLISKKFIGAFKKNHNPMLLFVGRYSLTDDDIIIHITFENDTNPPLINGVWIE